MKIIPALNAVKTGVKVGGKFVKQNLPTICTVAGVVGMGVSVFVGCKATLKAEKVLNDLEVSKESKGEPVTIKEKVTTLVPVYFWTGIIFAASTALIFYAHKVDLTHIAALGTVATLKEKELEEEKEKIKNFLPAKKQDDMHYETAHDLVMRTISSNLPIYNTGEGDTIFIDKTTGIWFTHDINKLKAIVNDLNADMYHSSGPAWGCGEIPHSAFIGSACKKLPVPEFTNYIGYYSDKGSIPDDLNMTSVRIDGLYYNVIDLGPTLLPSYKGGWN